MINFTNNKKLNIKINILLAAFLENEFHNNEICIEEINRLIDELVQLIINFVSLLNPEVVILGGGIMEQVDYLKPLVQKRFNALYGNPFVAEHTTIDFASLGNQAGVLGAYSYFKKQNLK